MSLGTDGSPESVDSAILPDVKGAPQQSLAAFRAERRDLYQYIAAQQQRIKELEARLKRYENAHPPSEQGGAAGSVGGGSSSSDDEEAGPDDADSAGGD